jgi:DNA-binding NtrC family response regulator
MGNFSIAESEQTILVLDDDPDFLNKVRLMLTSHDVKNVEVMSSGSTLLDYLDQDKVSVLLMDWIMPDISGADLLPMVIERYPHIPVIIMTAVNDLQTVVGCIKQGAFDYITKPIDINRLLSSLNKAFHINELATQNQKLKEYLLGNRLLKPGIFGNIITINPRMQAIFKIVEAMGSTSNPVMITGETGVGKELIARAIHSSSGLGGAFVALNVAGLDDHMFADTLFGHKKGAFTGAHDSREGLISKAQGGTLFLDEIGDLGSESQVKLLRLLQEREYYRLGSDALIKSDARIITASNRDFEAMLSQGRFRRDLFHRLRSHHIHVPPLRERTEDIPLLIDHFLDDAARGAGRTPPSLTKEARYALGEYLYPGNVRELINLIQNAVACNADNLLNLADFPGLAPASDLHHRNLRILRDRRFRLQAFFDEFPTLVSVEQMIIDEALRLAEGNKSIAADLLGISRSTLHRKSSFEEPQPEP